MKLMAVSNAQTYNWADWIMGIMRSFMSGGAAALITGSGGSVLGIPGNTVWKLMGINFILMGLYRMGEFLQLHGAPDKIQVDVTETTSKKVGATTTVVETKLSGQIPQDTNNPTKEG